MIQEPYQPEIIEIPLRKTMSTELKNSSKNELLLINKDNNLKNQNSSCNSKNQGTLIQIPQQKVKPRIFLLTRPSKPQLVRLETQTVRPHHQRSLNLSQPHHPQATVTTTPETIVNCQTQAKIIRIPFLPRSQVKTFLVKSNTNQVLKKDLKIVPQKTIQNQNKTQVNQYSDHTHCEVLPNATITQEQINTNQLFPFVAETKSNNPLQTQKESVSHTRIQVKSTVNNSLNTQTKTQSEVPLTLSSMAGIELTSADMSLSQADMSGAMPPTATVEEINVPVFIDEYIQEVTASGTSGTGNNNITINNNNNTNTSNNNNCNDDNHSDEKGNEVNNFLDTLENFEFDINLLTENSNKTALEVQEEDQQYLHQQHQQQQKLTEVDDDKKFKQHQFELQLMLEDILFNNSNNNNNNTHNSTNHSNNNMALFNEVMDDNDNNEVFKVLPDTDSFEIDLLTSDDMDNTNFSSNLLNTEDAIDFNSIPNDFSINDCFISSQPAEIMFSSGYSQSQSSSQNIINEILKAEPYITHNYLGTAPAATTSLTAAASPLEVCSLTDDMETLYSTEYHDENSSMIDGCKQTKTLVNPLKRNSVKVNQHMLEKRRKLHLDTKQCKENNLLHQSEITTPKVIDFIDQLNDNGIMGATAATSIQIIYDELIASSPKCASIKSEICMDDSSTSDISAPNTPYSVNSISNQTSFLNTAPSSPASSVATTTNTWITNTTKRGRGRPAKAHSDIPDHSQIQHLSESEQKKVLERAKNNEASRKSRLKHKERGNALEREEIELLLRNSELEEELKDIVQMENKLKRALKRRHFSN